LNKLSPPQRLLLANISERKNGNGSAGELEKTGARGTRGPYFFPLPSLRAFFPKLEFKTVAVGLWGGERVFPQNNFKDLSHY